MERYAPDTRRLQMARAAGGQQTGSGDLPGGNTAILST
jgi:hypothetical protein